MRGRQRELPSSAEATKTKRSGKGVHLDMGHPGKIKSSMDNEEFEKFFARETWGQGLFAMHFIRIHTTADRRTILDP